MPRLRFALALGLALATLAHAPRARADEGDADKGDKTTEKEKTADKSADKDKDAGAAPELRYPPFSTRFKVLTAGIVVAGAAWGVAFGASRGWPEQTCVIGVTGPVTPGSANTPNPIPCQSGPPGSNQLGIPFVGPWIALAKSGCPTDNPACLVATPIGRGFAYVIDGVVQLGGLGLIVQALVMKTESTSDPAKKGSALTLHYRGVEMTPVPLAGPGAAGLSLIGTF